MAMCAFNFGYDVGTFGGIQGLQSFTSQFGEYQPDTKLYALPGWLSSVMTATPFLGKAAVRVTPPSPTNHMTRADQSRDASLAASLLNAQAERGPLLSSAYCP